MVYHSIIKKESLDKITSVLQEALRAVSDLSEEDGGESNPKSSPIAKIVKTKINKRLARESLKKDEEEESSYYSCDPKDDLKVQLNIPNFSSDDTQALLREMVIEPLVERLEANLQEEIKLVRGCVVKCDLWAFEHSGIYVGEGRFIHRSGEGYIEETTYDQFLKRLDGKNIALSIYVACRNSKVLADEAIARRALRALEDGHFAGYNLLFKNCHHFTQYCITGQKIETPLNCSFKFLDTLLRDNFDVNIWRLAKI